MQLGYGLITNQRYPGDARTATDVYYESIELTKLCESAGLDSVWTSEHHFWDDDYMPSLLVLSGALAAVTKTITVGTAVLLAPLYHPIRLAEDAATVDLISGGRFVLGLGIGWRQEEFDRLGIPMQSLGRRMREIVDVCRLAWGPSTFTYDGKVFNFEPTNVTPKPSRPIPIWIGGFAEPALRRAGRIGDGYLGSSSRRHAPMAEDIAARAEVVREGLRKAGRDESQFAWAFHEAVWPCDDPSEFEEIIPFIHYSRWKYRDMGAEFGRATGAELPSPPAIDDETRETIKASVLYGSPDEIAEKVLECRKALGADFHFIARTNFPGVPFDKAARAIELLGEVRKKL